MGGVKMTEAIITSLIMLFIYILISIFLNKFNRLVYGKGTAMCFIPIANIYLIGKLAVNKTVGWLLVIGIFLNARYTITINNVETVYRLFPENVSEILYKVEECIIFVLFIYGINKYFEIKNSKKNQQTLEK